MTKRVLAALALLALYGVVAPGLMAFQNPNANNTSKWQTKGEYEYRTYRLRPTDWPQGIKTAWSNCSADPQKAGKDCKYVVYEGRFIYYYSGEGGTVYARRPINRIYQPHDTAKNATK